MNWKQYSFYAIQFCIKQLLSFHHLCSTVLHETVLLGARFTWSRIYMFAWITIKQLPSFFSSSFEDSLDRVLLVCYVDIHMHIDSDIQKLGWFSSWTYCVLSCILFEVFQFYRFSTYTMSVPIGTLVILTNTNYLQGSLLNWVAIH